MAEQLREDVRNAVKATVPALEEHGLEVIQRFYDLMFEKYPGTRAYFSDGAFQGNMKVPPQVIRLGGAVTAFAKHIDNPEVLMDAIRKICEIHVSRGVRSPHYPIVGQCLLEAMKEILKYDGEEWGVAYNWLAQVFIDVEKGIRARGKETAGYVGFRQYNVEQMIEEGGGVTSIILKPGEFDLLETRDAGGKFVCLAFCTPDTKYRSKITAYLSDVGQSDHLRVTVDKKAVANLDSSGTVGVSPAFGTFTVEDVAKASNVVLVSTGLEIARMFAILKSLTFFAQNRSQHEDNEAGTNLVFLVASESGSHKNFLLEVDVKKLEQDNDLVSIRVLKERTRSITSAELLEEVDGALESEVGNATIVLSPTFKTATEALKSKYKIHILD